MAGLIGLLPRRNERQTEDKSAGEHRRGGEQQQRRVSAAKWRRSHRGRLKVQKIIVGDLESAIADAATRTDLKLGTDMSRIDWGSLDARNRLTTPRRLGEGGKSRVADHRQRRRLSCALFCIVVGLSVACGRTDADLRVALSAQMAVDPATAPLSLTVTVERGVVHLAGETSTRAEQKRVVEIAERIDGVTRVVSELRLSDAVIAGAVKQALAADALTGRLMIDVDSHEGLVRLMSADTNRSERERAVQLAAQVDGVTRVEDRMR